MNLTKKTNLKILKNMRQRLMRKKLCIDLEKKMADAVEEGDFDKVLECKFLRDRL